MGGAFHGIQAVIHCLEEIIPEKLPIGHTRPQLDSIWCTHQPSKHIEHIRYSVGYLKALLLHLQEYEVAKLSIELLPKIHWRVKPNGLC